MMQILGFWARVLFVSLPAGSLYLIAEAADLVKFFARSAADWLDQWSH